MNQGIGEGGGHEAVAGQQGAAWESVPEGMGSSISLH